jgi:hypothetical protein
VATRGLRTQVSTPVICSEWKEVARFSKLRSSFFMMSEFESANVNSCSHEELD